MTGGGEVCQWGEGLGRLLDDWKGSGFPSRLRRGHAGCAGMVVEVGQECWVVIAEVGILRFAQNDRRGRGDYSDGVGATKFGLTFYGCV